MMLLGGPGLGEPVLLSCSPDIQPAVLLVDSGLEQHLPCTFRASYGFYATASAKTWPVSRVAALGFMRLKRAAAAARRDDAATHKAS